MTHKGGSGVGVAGMWVHGSPAWPLNNKDTASELLSACLSEPAALLVRACLSVPDAVQDSDYAAHVERLLPLLKVGLCVTPGKSRDAEKLRCGHICVRCARKWKKCMMRGTKQTPYFPECCLPMLGKSGLASCQVRAAALTTTALSAMCVCV